MEKCRDLENHFPDYSFRKNTGTGSLHIKNLVKPSHYIWRSFSMVERILSSFFWNGLESVRPLNWNTNTAKSWRGLTFSALALACREGGRMVGSGFAALFQPSRQGRQDVACDMVVAFVLNKSLRLFNFWTDPDLTSRNRIRIIIASPQNRRT